MSGAGLMEKLKHLIATSAKGMRGNGSLDSPDPLVASAAILLEMAESDQDFAVEERRVIESMLREKFDLSDEQVQALLAEAERERALATDLFPFTHAIAEAYTPEQKLTLLVMVWRVIFADGRLDPYEDQLAHRLQRMLAVNHSLLMEAKQVARQEAGTAG